MTDNFEAETDTLAKQIRDKAIEMRIKEAQATPSDTPDPRPGVIPQPSGVPMSPGQRQQLEADYAWILKAFKPYARPEPAKFDPLITACQGTADHLRSSPDLNIDSLEGQLTDWVSPAAQSFRKEFIKPFGEATVQQILVTEALKMAMEANKEIFKRSRANVKDVGQKTLTSLTNLGTGGANAVSTFTILAGVVTIAAGIAAIPVSGGTSGAVAAAGFTIVAGASTVAAGAASETPPTKNVDIKGGTVDEVLSSFVFALGEANTQIDQAERKIVTTLDGISSELSGSHRNGYLPPEPQISGLTGPPKDPKEYFTHND